MSLDLEDRLTRGLTDLARNAPVPSVWPDLGGPGVGLGDDPVRPRPAVTVAVAAAAAIVVVAAIALALSRGDEPAKNRVAAAPRTGVTAAPMGRWDANGPRLTDAQLVGIVAAVTQPDGDVVVEPRSSSSTEYAGRVLDAGRRVTRVSVVETSMGAIWHSLDPRSLNGPTASQMAAIQRYVAGLDAKAGSSPPTDAEWSEQSVKVAVVASVPAGPASACAASSTGGSPDCVDPTLGAVWLFDDDSEQPILSRPQLLRPLADILTPLGPVGHWTPN